MQGNVRTYHRPNRLTDNDRKHYFPAPTFKMFALDCDFDIDFTHMTEANTIIADLRTDFDRA